MLGNSGNGEGAGERDHRFAAEENLSFLAGLDGASSAQSSVAAFELVHTTGGVDEFLLAGEKGMARGTNTNFDVLAGRARAIRRTAGTNDDGFDVIGMNRGLHFCENLSN
jgi:hypothetical protein